MHRRRRAGAIWVALVALLGNILLPATLSIFVLKAPGRDVLGVSLCGHRSGDAPGKSEPRLVVQHCPLCTVPVAPLPWPLSIVVPGQVADESRLQLLTTVSVAPIRHGRVRARAPPTVV